MSKYLSDILILTGCVCITAGAAMFSPALALLVGGGFCAAIGVVMALNKWLAGRLK